ncbi:MAG TPA: POTRA domain-containing protein, partial [Flavitalea sp.]|nr:POTRA domain-containing protein [Flavitalea sp.]
MPFENIYQCLIRTLTCCCFSLQLCAQTGNPASGTLNVPTFPDHSVPRPGINAPHEDTLPQVVVNERPAFVVGEIIVTGNKRTKDYVIARELPFKSGDSINLTDLVKQFEIARQQLINTKLFTEAV